MTTADATRKTTKATLRTAPIIVLASVGQVYGAGVWATTSVTNKLGIVPQRLANGRGYVSIEQAEAIAEELSQRIKGNGELRELSYAARTSVLRPNAPR